MGNERVGRGGSGGGLLGGSAEDFRSVTIFAPCSSDTRFRLQENSLFLSVFS